MINLVTIVVEDRFVTKVSNCGIVLLENKVHLQYY